MLDAVDSPPPPRSSARRRPRGIKVVTYDRPIPDTPADFYVSFDNKKIGSLIAAVTWSSTSIEGDTPRAACSRSTARPPTPAAG